MKLPSLNTLKIVFYPDPVLHQKSAPIEDFGDSLKRLTDRMLELMQEGKGVGLAAPQVGLLRRFFVCNVTGEPGDDRVFVNPTLSDLSGGELAEEGCLSLPGVTVEMRRATSVVIRAMDVHGEPFECSGQGLLARVWQHEFDHLDGRLITDRMSSTDEIANRRAIKQLESDHAELKRIRKSR